VGITSVTLACVSTCTPSRLISASVAADRRGGERRQDLVRCLDQG
jgi:hypothetical protein